ncbi:MAG: hypothetical protein PHQ52_00155 [Candidatus Omnitrophica bacterium]|nr:hypothetical protein [Candidatus Omnitrophota bacterium]
MTRKNKKYFRPKVKCIPLSQEQATLQVCRIGGAYFGFTDAFPSWCFGVGTTQPRVYECDVTVKGQSFATDRGNPNSADTQPS